MTPPSILVFDNNLALESVFDDFHEFKVYPNFVLQKDDCSQREKQISVDPISIRSVSETSSMRIDSFNIMLPPAMSPPRDSTVPLPFPPTPVKMKKKLSKQESLLFLKKRHSYNNNSSSFQQYDKKIKQSDSFDSYEEDEVKCGPFCMFLPSFGKSKPVRSSVKRDDYYSIDKKSSMRISTRVSMEKFECGSWATSVLAHDNENFFLDFPAVEMVKRSSGELHKPVSSGFVFDKEPLVVKGVLKNSSSSKSSRRSAESSPRRVRFSTTSSSSVSCPTYPRSCITPRLRKAREDFNAFLEAQNA